MHRRVLTAQFKVRGDYTATFTRDDTTDLGLLRRPANKASVSTIWLPTDKLSITTTFLYVSSWVDYNRSGTFLRMEAPGYKSVKVAAEYAVTDNVTLFGRIENLFDGNTRIPLVLTVRDLAFLAA